MSLLRFNPFSQVHKGLRALLYDTALLLQQTNFLQEEEIQPLLERVKLVNALFAHHAHIEDQHVFPLIETYAPQVVADFEAQHQTDHLLSRGLEKCLALFDPSNTPEQNQWAGNELLQHFNAFLAFNVEHMKKEETIVNNYLWQYYSDDELQQKVQEIAASIPPQENQHFAYWMLKGLGVHEVIAWFNELKLAAPPPVFEKICELAETALPAGKWNTVKENLQEGALLA